MPGSRLSDNKKKMGRPATGIGQLVGVRLRPDYLAALDKWAAKQPDKPSRPEAIRRLLAGSLKVD